MNRQQRRENERKSEKYQNSTYNLTKSQLDNTIRQSIETELNKAYQDGMNDGMDKAMILLLTLPVEVLKDFYWKKSYEKKIPEFTDRILEYYEKWQNGELDMDKMKEDLQRYAGVRVEEMRCVNIVKMESL